jgi:hypothetical protein
MDDPCRHCCQYPIGRPRGLCWKCFYTPGVRELYPILPNPNRRRSRHYEPTEAELDAMIAEQLPTMPPNDEDVEYRVNRTRRRKESA